MVAAAVCASAAAASDAGAGEKSSLTTGADDTAVDISGSLSGAALKFNPIWHRMAETVTDKERIISLEGNWKKLVMPSQKRYSGPMQKPRCNSMLRMRLTGFS